MPDYFFEFVAHLDRLRKPDHFPDEVSIKELYQQIPNDDSVKDLYNRRFHSLIGQPGIVVYLDSEATIESAVLNFDKRVYIPWHMITYFHGRVKVVTPQPIAETPLDSLSPQDPDPEPEQGSKLIQ